MARLTDALFRVALRIGSMARVAEAVAAGTVPMADLRAGVAREWEDFNIRPEEVFSGLLPWERVIYDEVLGPGDRLLIIGSGSGRELIALAERGHEVVGVDPSGPALAAARAFVAERGVQALLLPGFFEDVQVPGRFDVVIFSYRCYGMIAGSAHRVEALRKARVLLHDGGRMIVSYASGRGMHPFSLRMMRLAAALSRSGARPEPGDDVYRIAESHPYFGFEHHFAPGEFEAEAALAGLHVESVVDRACPAAVLIPAGAVVPALSGPTT